MSAVLHVHRVPSWVSHTAVDCKPDRYCFGCKRRTVHTWEMVSADSPWYEPVPQIKCGRCGEDRVSFPGWYLDGPRYPEVKLKWTPTPNRYDDDSAASSPSSQSGSAGSPLPVTEEGKQMPYRDRAGRRPRPLDHPTTTTIEPYDGLTIYSAPGYMHFIEAMWHGDYQQVPVDPENLAALIDALRPLLPDTEEEGRA